MICEFCNNVHDGTFATGRFCNRSCSVRYSSNKKRAETNLKISNSLAGRPSARKGIPGKMHSEEAKSQIAETLKSKYANRDFEELGFKSKRERLFQESKYSCTMCNFNKFREDGGCILEIDHIDGDHKNNTRENLRVLCPNCHALTPNFRNWGRTSKYKTSKRIRKGNKDFVPSSQVEN